MPSADGDMVKRYIENERPVCNPSKNCQRTPDDEGLKVPQMMDFENSWMIDSL